jgi:hypothetical protein
MASDDAAIVRRLRAEIRADRDALAERCSEVEQFSSDTEPVPAERPGALALALDRAYTAMESILDRVARTLEGGAPTGADWHRSLLRNASLDIEGVRPAILSAESEPALDELRRFRHFVRHAYAAPLDWPRVRRASQVWLDALPRVQDDLDAFETFLTKLAEELDAPRKPRP